MACALAQQGRRVGLLDADVYGPRSPGRWSGSHVLPSKIKASGAVCPALRRGLPLADHGSRRGDTDRSDGPLKQSRSLPGNPRSPCIKLRRCTPAQMGPWFSVQSSSAHCHLNQGRLHERGACACRRRDADVKIGRGCERAHSGPATPRCSARGRAACRGGVAHRKAPDRAARLTAGPACAPRCGSALCLLPIGMHPGIGIVGRQRGAAEDMVARLLPHHDRGAR